jgi:hypothetical protein
VLHAAPGGGPLPDPPERLSGTTLLILGLLVVGLGLFALVFTLIALVVGGPVLAVIVAAVSVVAAGFLVLRLVRSVRT